MALQRFLFVGLGGSGGMTVAALRHMLQLQLAAVEHDDGIPRGWQFINIDVAATQGGTRSGIMMLPDREYLGLTYPMYRHREEDPYRHLYHTVTEYKLGADYVDSWAPKPEDATRIKIEHGAAQYRALGRVTGCAMITEVNRRLAAAFGTLKSQETHNELARVSEKLTRRNSVSDDPIQAIVISSLAGGSGSGQIADVCDLIRQYEPGVASQLVAILYAPDIFKDVDETERSGVNPNALATIAELLNGHWNTEEPSAQEFALLWGGGAVSSNIRLRGPSRIYIVGRANGAIEFNTQYEVYRSTARALAAWTTNAELQTRFRQYELVTTAPQKRDTSNLKDNGGDNPFGSIGFASVGIGVERFARYSSQRLARSVVEHLLWGHWPLKERKKITEEDARTRRAGEVLAEFLRDCGLQELGRETGPDEPGETAHPRQISNAIRGDTLDRTKISIRDRIMDPLVDQVTAGAPRGLSRQELLRRVRIYITNNFSSDVDEVKSERLDSARQWTEELQKHVELVARKLVAAQGARVACQVLEMAISELRGRVTDDLRTMATRNDDQVTDQKAKLDYESNAGDRLKDNPGPLIATNRAIRETAEAVADMVHAKYEKHLADQCRLLIDDVAVNLLMPLRDAIDVARKALQLDSDGTPERPSVVEAWPEKRAPTTFEPAQNELLLEPVSKYPELFESLVVPSSSSAFDTVLAQACREVIMEKGGSQDKVVITTEGKWFSRQSELRDNPSASPARFDVHIRAEQLLARARSWLRRSGSSFGDYFNQTLANYLHGPEVGEDVARERQSNFSRLLKEARRASLPFVELDGATYTEIHGGLPHERSLLTPFPFPLDHPGRDIVGQVFHDWSELEVGSLFGDEPVDRIDIFTFLSAPVQPMVMHSLVDPIRRQWTSIATTQSARDGFWKWRRTRPLPWFVPCAPEVRKAMVCGWFVARLLGYIGDVDPDKEPTRIYSPEQGWIAFPYPLLGPEISCREEWIPAVLESLAIAVVVRGLSPYHRLRELGSPIMVPDRQSGDLQTWIDKGTVAAGAETPTEELAGPAKGDAEQRRTALKQTVNEYLANFETVSTTRKNKDGTGTTRAWELREDILQALNAIRQVVTSPPPTSVGGLG